MFREGSPQQELQLSRLVDVGLSVDRRILLTRPTLKMSPARCKELLTGATQLVARRIKRRAGLTTEA
jgi:hypothetical protein